MIDKCERCGERSLQYLERTATDVQGQQLTVHLCQDCYFGCKNLSWITLEGKGRVSLIPLYQVEEPEQQGKDVYAGRDRETYVVEQQSKEVYIGGGWTSFLKAICIINAVIMTIMGFVLGGKIADIISYSNDWDIVIGTILGGIIGFAVGIILIAFVMVICEISTTLKEIHIELRRNRIK